MIKNKIALITGAAGVLGEIHSEALLELKFDLIITDINLKLLKKRSKNLEKKFPNSKIVPIKLDVTSENQMKKVLNIIKKNLKKLMF